MKAHIKTGLGFIGFRLQWLSLLTLAMLFNCTKTKAQTAKNFNTSQPFLFEENKGQLNSAPYPRQRGTATNNDIKYYGHSGGVYVYCKTGMISFVFTKVENESNDVSEATGQPVSGVGGQNPEPLHHKQPLPQDAFNASLQGKITTARMDLVLLNSNPNPEITASDQQEYYENFYTTGDANQGITNVHTYKTLTYKNIYPNIDMALNASDNGMEYSFLVHPGGNVSDIKLRWNGAEKEEALKNGGVKYANILGSMEESAPKSFVDGKLVASRFKNTGLSYGFQVNSYDKKKNLVIDPTLVWGTYFGGSRADQGYGVCTDASGNVYILGATESNSGIATSGAYLTSNGDTSGGFVFLAKFNSSGSLQWATYYGDSYNVAGMGITADGSGNVYITGNTQSSSGIATSGAYQTSYSGGLYNNAFLAKFSSSGSLQWGTYYGGNGYANTWGIATDGSNNVFISGTTSDSSGIATTGAYQSSLGGPYNAGGYFNAFLAKFNSNGSLQWGTYYGGSSYSEGFCVATDGSDNAYLTGMTVSSSGIATSGAYQTSSGGNEDAFLAKFSSSGNLTWATYFGGNGQDNGYGIATDNGSGSVYITGRTVSSSGIATAGAYQTSFGGNTDAFIAKFSYGGSLQWATYYGGPGEDNESGIAIDQSGNAYMTGDTRSNSGIATQGAYLTSVANIQSAFLVKFSPSGSRQWATYYGENFASGQSITTHGSGDVYITGYTSGSPGIATSGAYQTAFGGNEDAFLAKFNFSNNDAGISLIQSPNSVCPEPLWLNVQLKNFGNDNLDSVKIGWSINRKIKHLISWSGSLKTDSNVTAMLWGNDSFRTGIDTIKVWTYRPNGEIDSVPQNDTAIEIITVLPNPPTNVGKSRTVCSGIIDTLGASAISGNTYFWQNGGLGGVGVAANVSDPHISNPTTSPKDTTKYFLVVTGSNGCKAIDSVTLSVIPLPKANAGKDASICSGDSVLLGTNPDTSYSYSWSSSPSGFSSTVSNPGLLPNLNTTYYLKVTSNIAGCTGFDTVKVKVNAIPVASFSVSDSIFCQSDSLTVFDSDTQSVSYVWNFGDGVSDTGQYPPKHYYKSGIYHVWLKLKNTTGCSDSTEKTIHVDGSCVWPGDANYDKVDNIYDLLAIGIAYNDTGSKRADTTTQWYAYPCMDWSNNFKSGANHKHSDCNGDGIVDSLDMAAIVSNYSKTHSKSGGSISSGNPNDPALSLSISKDSVGTSDTISVQMNLGTASKSLSNIYGLCYTVTYDPVNVGRAKSVSADFSNSWLGTLNKNLVYLVHNDSVNGVMDIGITRTDHKNVSGYGEIGKLTIIMPDNVGGKKLIRKELLFGLENIKAIDNAEDDISLYTSGDSVLFYGYSGIEPLNISGNNIHLYPNPAHSSLQIDAGKDFISEIEVSDILGRNVLSLKYNLNQQAELNINNLVPGTYFIYILTDHGFARSRFVKD